MTLTVDLLIETSVKKIIEEISIEIYIEAKLLKNVRKQQDYTRQSKTVLTLESVKDIRNRLKKARTLL